MTIINDAYINALLADATYALDDTVKNGLSGNALRDKIKGRMTSTLAQYNRGLKFILFAPLGITSSNLIMKCQAPQR